MRLLRLFCLLSMLTASFPAAALQPAVAPDQLDLPNCTSWGGGALRAAPPAGVLPYLLGIGGEPGAWETGPVAGEIRHFRIAFTAPLPLGTIALVGDAQVAALRPGVAFPGIIDQDADWQLLGAGPVVTLPPGFRTQALRITRQNFTLPWAPDSASSQLPEMRLLSDRCFMATQLGGNAWQGDDWYGYWVRSLEIAAVYVLGVAEAGEIAFLETTSAHPLTAPADAWQRFDHLPTAAQAVRWRGAVARRTRPVILPLVRLPEGEAAPSLLPQAPVSVDYQMPMDGFVALHLRDAEGRHVRRLVAEVERPTGAVHEGWDLQDDAGRYIAPGRYTWEAVVRPPLRLTYEMSLYNPGKPPWLAPVRGGGSWMSDHSPPAAVTAVGEKLVFAAPGAEFGQPLIVTDLEGNKLWHHGHMGHGAKRLASNGTDAFLVNDDAVTRLTMAEYKLSPVVRFSYSPDLPGHASTYIPGASSGTAAWQELLVIAYHSAPPAWIRSTLRPHDFDLRQSFPPVTGEKVHDTELTPPERVYSTFQAMRSSQQAYFGDAAPTGAMGQMLLLRLNHARPLGSILLPDRELDVYALRPGRQLPPEFAGAGQAAPGMGLNDAVAGDFIDLGDLDVRFDPEVWLRLEMPPGEGPAIADTQQGLMTSALLFKKPRLKRLEYALPLDRRYRDAANDARLVLGEGSSPNGRAWHFERPAQQPVSEGSPALAALVWDEARPLRGFTLIRPRPWAGLTVDLFTGADDLPITPATLADESLWERQFTHRQTRGDVKWNWHYPILLSGDFGGSRLVRALRIRYAEPSTSPDRPYGGSQAFDAVVAYEHLGNDPELTVSLAQRLTVVDTKAGKVLRHFPVEGPGALAFAPNGDLYAHTASGVIRYADFASQRDELKGSVVLPPAEARHPYSMTVDEAGHLYLADPRTREVRVYDPATGTRLRTIGKPGQLGPYDPATFTLPTAIDIDSRGKLWVVEQHFQPKRISRWSREGTYEAEWLGPTHYGGGGMMDPRDRSVVNHLGMKFRIDWEARTWRLEARLVGYNSGIFLPDRVVYRDNQRFLIGDRPIVTPFGDNGPISVICEEIDRRAVVRVATGLLAEWPEVKVNPAIREAAAASNPALTPFVWVDANLDGSVSLDEVRILTGISSKQPPMIGDDFSLNFRVGARLRPRAFTADGLPIYAADDVEVVPAIDQPTMTTADGRTFVMHHRLLAADGRQLWEYADRYLGVQASNKVPWGFYGRPPGVLCGGFSLLGHFQVGEEEFFCVGGNNGDYFAFTADGFLAAAILGGPRGYGRRFFSMPDWRYGETDLSDLRKTVEDFHGHVTRAEDGNVYAIAGKNHITIIRVDGLEQLQRLRGELTISADDLQQTRAWAAEHARLAHFRQLPKRLDVPYMFTAPVIDGDIVTDWPDTPPLEIRTTYTATGLVRESWQARMAFDNQHLYLALHAVEDNPFANRGEDDRNLFQQGDAWDIQLGPVAQPDRTDPLPGDLRLLITRVDGQPRLLLYRYRLADGPGPTAHTYTSPVGSTRIDAIEVIEHARIHLHQNDRTGIVEAAIPWQSLGMQAPTQSFQLRGDIGVLESDAHGISTVNRTYWANQSLVVLGDLPSEARLVPSLWGDLHFHLPDVADQLLDDLR